MIEEHLIVEYMNAFEKHFKPFLKSYTKVKTNIYPFNTGVLFVMRLSSNVNSFECEFRRGAQNLYEAMKRTGLVTVDKKDVSITKKTLLLGKSSFIIIIPDTLFDISKAESDVNMVIKSIREK